ncbi:MAG: hypothetical protein AMK73_06095, partial [Planctomycetes bacterium SM23_32]
EDDPAAYPWDTHQDYTAAQITSEMSTIAFTVSHSAYLKRVWWRYKEPLEDGQKVIVLVRVDGLGNWDENPEQDGDGDPQTSDDWLWGYIDDGSADPDGGQLALYKSGVKPRVNSKVEVRFLFDLGQTHPYNTGVSDGSGPPLASGLQKLPDPGAGWTNMVEVDEVGVEMLAEPQTF